MKKTGWGSDLIPAGSIIQKIELKNLADPPPPKLAPFSSLPTRVYITSLLQMNARRNKPIPNIGIIDVGAEGFIPFSSEQTKLIKEFRLVLFLCSVVKSNIYSGPNAGLYMVTADNFTLIFQNFQLGSLSGGFSTGSIVNIRSGGG